MGDEMSRLVIVMILLLAALIMPLAGCNNNVPAKSGRPGDGAETDPQPLHVLDITGPDTVVDIPRLDGFTLTASQTEWANRGFSVEILDAYKLRLEASDFSVSFRLGWDAKGLLFFTTIVDDHLGPPTDDTSLWSGDGDQAAIYITPQQGFPCARIAVSPGVESNGASPVVLFTPPFETGEERPKPVRVAFERSFEKTDGGYTLALRIPWSDLRMTPRDGLEFGFQVLFQDADGGGVHRWYPELGTAADSRRTRRLRLANAPSAPVTAVIDRIAHLSDGSIWITASATRESVGNRLRIVDADELVVEVDLVDDGSGYARARVVVDDSGAHPFPLYTPRGHKASRPPEPSGKHITPMRAGVACRDITLLDCISGEPRVIDPLFGKVLVVEDPYGTRVAIVTLDLIGPDFPGLRERMKSELGIQHTFINSSHTHSVARSSRSSDWYSRAEQLLWEAVNEAVSDMAPVSLSAGRAPVEIGYNRNREQYSRAVVPWVNVLVVNRLEEAQGPSEETPAGGPAPPLAVLYEYAAHPVVTQNSGHISADFPAYAVEKIRAELGDTVVPMFAQGCGGSLNAWPAGFDCDYEWEIRAAKAGKKIGDAVVHAVANAERLDADRFVARHKDIELPCQLPSPTSYAETLARLQQQDPPWHSRESWERSLKVVKAMMEGGEQPKWGSHVDVLMLGDEWCLIALPGEVYGEYELWAERQVRHPHKMVFGYTNGQRGYYYFPTDDALNLGVAEPLIAERGCNWAASWPAFFSGVPIDGAMLPLAPGTERIIKDAIAELTREPATTPIAQVQSND